MMRLALAFGIFCLSAVPVPTVAMTVTCPLVYGQNEYFPAVTEDSPDGRSVNESDLGPLLDVVSAVSLDLRGLRGPGCLSPLRTGRGDDVPVYAFHGYREDFRVIIRRGGRLIPYEVHHRAGMKRGVDMLDISGRVMKVTIKRSRAVPPNDTHSLRWRADVTDKDQVRDIVNLVLSGSVRRGPPDPCAPERRLGMFTHVLLSYTLMFHMADGTIVQRHYVPGSGSLTGPIVVHDLRNVMDEIFASKGIHFDDCPAPNISRSAGE